MKKYILLALISIWLQVYASFSDIDESNEFSKWISYIQSKWIIKGYPDWTFRPDKNINRAEFLKVMMSSTSGFDIAKANNCVDNIKKTGQNSVYLSDVAIDAWYAPYVCIAFDQKIIKWYEDWTFRALDQINIPEMSKLIAISQNIPSESPMTWDEWYVPYVKAVWNKNAFPTSLEKINQKLKRWEVAEVLYRILWNQTKLHATNYARLLWTESENISKSIESWKLWKIDNCSQLASIMKKPEYWFTSTSFGLNPVSNSKSTLPPPSNLANPSHEKTINWVDNLQSSIITSAEQINEADFVKTDWKYIYKIHNNEVKIIEAQPINKLNVVWTFSIEWQNFMPLKLFAQQNKLIILWNSYKNFYETQSKESNYSPPSNTELYIIDTSDKSKTKIERHIAYEWSLVEAKLIWDQIFLIINKEPDSQIFKFIKNLSDEITPKIMDTSVSDQPKSISRCQDIEFFPGYEKPNYLIVSIIPLDRSENVINKTFLGSSENIYLSNDHLYIATWVNDVQSGFWNRNNTQVYKFGFWDWNINLMASNQVSWRILNKFAINEFENNVRIATTVNEWKWDIENNLYILDSNLIHIWVVKSLAQWERMSSVKFLWKTAYLSTSTNVNNFFVLDLSDSQKPSLSWELKMPEWPNYFQYYDETHVIGFWKDIISNSGGSKLIPNDASWIKIALFDISNHSSPKEIQKITIWDNWTSSELLYNPRTLYFNKDSWIMAFPIQIKENIKQKAWNCYAFNYNNCPINVCQMRCTPTKCSNWVCTNDCNWPWSCIFKDNQEVAKVTFDWAEFISISNLVIKEIWRVSNYPNDIYTNTSWETFPTNSQKNIQRIIWIDNYLYTIANGFIKALDNKISVKKTLEIK